MKSIFVCCLLLAAMAVGLFAVSAPVWAAEPAASKSPGSAKKIRVLLTSGGHGFDEKAFYATFDANPDIEYSKASLPKDADLLKPGLEKQYDVIVMYDMVKQITPAQQEAFVALLKQGIGVVSLHHNLGAHPDWAEFTKIIGGRYVFKPFEADGKTWPKSGFAHGQTMKIHVANKSHAITKGVDDFEVKDETYSDCYVAPDVKVLLTTDNPKNTPSLAWVHQYGKSRVFYFQLGHDKHAYENAGFRKVLAGGIRWAAGKE